MYVEQLYNKICKIFEGLYGKTIEPSKPDEQKVDEPFQTSIQVGNIHLLHLFKSGAGSKLLNDLKIVKATLISGGVGPVEIKIISAELKTGVKFDLSGVGAKFEAGVNFIETDIAGVKSKVGINFDSGMLIDCKGLEIKIAGIGLKIGEEVGISTPIGAISVDFSTLKNYYKTMKDKGVAANNLAKGVVANNLVKGIVANHLVNLPPLYNVKKIDLR